MTAIEENQSAVASVPEASLPLAPSLPPPSSPASLDPPSPPELPPASGLGASQMAKPDSILQVSPAAQSAAVVHTCLSFPHAVPVTHWVPDFLEPQQSWPVMHPEFDVQVTTIMPASLPLLVPELLVVPPLELPLEPPPLELLLLLLLAGVELHPDTAAATTQPTKATTLTARTIFIGFSLANPEVRTHTAPNR
jgi:hypothetical protein